MASAICTKMRRGIWGLVIFSIAVFSCQSAVEKEQAKPIPTQTKLPEILQKTKEYCRKLETAVFNFVCFEEITEEIKPPEGGHAKVVADTRNPPYWEITGRSEKNTYLYEYQLIKQKVQNEERRTLLDKNGRKETKKDARLETIRFYYEKIAFGPIDLLSGSGQLCYDYTIVEVENFNKGKTVVIEAAPKSSIKVYIPFGKIWVRESDFAILKIEWDVRSLANYKAVEERATKLKAKPSITLATEFDIEKNGIRFPSRVIFEEAYINQKGKKLIASEITILYKDYKFFTVETEVKY